MRGLGGAVGEAEFCGGVFGTGREAFEGAPGGVEIAEEAFDHVTDGGVVAMSLGACGPLGV